MKRVILLILLIVIIFKLACVTGPEIISEPIRDDPATKLSLQNKRLFSTSHLVVKYRDYLNRGK